MFKVDLYLFKMNSIPLFQNYKKKIYVYLFKNKIALKNIYYLNMLDLF